jgi:hypothetical protein
MMGKREKGGGKGEERDGGGGREGVGDEEKKGNGEGRGGEGRRCEMGEVGRRERAAGGEASSTTGV